MTWTDGKYPYSGGTRIYSRLNRRKPPCQNTARLVHPLRQNNGVWPTGTERDRVISSIALVERCADKNCESSIQTHEIDIFVNNVFRGYSSAVYSCRFEFDKSRSFASLSRNFMHAMSTLHSRRVVAYTLYSVWT